MNYFYDLPNDIQNYINEIAALKIIDIAARKFINRKKMLKELVNKIEEDSFKFHSESYITSCGGQRLYESKSVRTSNGIELLAKNINGRETKASIEESEFWNEVLKRITRAVYFDQFSSDSGRKGRDCWWKTWESYKKIYNKFSKHNKNFRITAEEFEEEVGADFIYGIDQEHL